MITSTAVKSLTACFYATLGRVGTLIDFERAIAGGPVEIGAKTGAGLDGEAALAVYRSARNRTGAASFADDADFTEPDDPFPACIDPAEAADCAFGH
ncbi:MAG: hypothetical protein P8Z80_18790 [Pseudolabrys sp.]